MRVLVCGGRNYNDRERVREVLGQIHTATPISVIIEGGATGADRLAFEWASEGNRCGTETHAADWRAHGRAAGPIRNGTMLRDGKPVLVVAFPGGRGTADMIDRARKAGIKVQVVPERESPCTICGTPTKHPPTCIECDASGRTRHASPHKSEEPKT